MTVRPKFDPMYRGDKKESVFRGRGKLRATTEQAVREMNKEAHAQGNGEKVEKKVKYYDEPPAEDDVAESQEDEQRSVFVMTSYQP